MFTSGVVSVVEDVFVLLLILGIMLYKDWRVALIAFAVLPSAIACCSRASNCATLVFRSLS